MNFLTIVQERLVAIEAAEFGFKAGKKLGLERTFPRSSNADLSNDAKTDSVRAV